MALNAQQQAIVDHDPSCHARVLAGPGTGKSFTSVQYLERLTKTHPELKVHADLHPGSRSRIRAQDGRADYPAWA